MRSIFYLTGTRADFGLIRSTLKAIDDHPELSVGVIVTGMHLDSRFGLTVSEVMESGLKIVARIEHRLEDESGSMARGIADVIQGVVTTLLRERPDIMLLLGDRGEMLAAAIAALHLNIPIAHIHGGERSGTVDEPIRHAISKLSHIHLVATAESAERLRRMGERPDTIHVVGAPGLDGLIDEVRQNRAQLIKTFRLVADNRPLALVVHHPVVQEGDQGADEVTAIIDALLNRKYQIIALQPNSDQGSGAIRGVYERYNQMGAIVLETHFPRSTFVSWVAIADVLIGNSSAGIIEAASFGTPVINVGTRQALRQRNANVIDADPTPPAISKALEQAELLGRLSPANVYGDGTAAKRIARVLAETRLDGPLLAKANVY